MSGISFCHNFSAKEASGTHTAGIALIGQPIDHRLSGLTWHCLYANLYLTLYGLDG
jgi:hypothetical protein